MGFFFLLGIYLSLLPLEGKGFSWQWPALNYSCIKILNTLHVECKAHNFNINGNALNNDFYLNFLL